MENLLPEIILNILSRLPTKSVLLCKLVCKTWRNLLNLPYFVDMHLRFHRQLLQLEDDDDDHQQYDASNFNCAADHYKLEGSSSLGLLFSIRFSDKDKGNVGLYYGEYNENNHEKFSYRKLTMINHPPLNKRRETYSMVGSCNGLICFSLREKYPDYVDHGVYICNPITKEHQKLHDRSLKDPPMVYGFGYLPSSNEYKIVIIYHGGRIQVYTLGSGIGWRNKGKTTACKFYASDKHCPSPPGILANGSLHWLDFKEQKIFAFDLAVEEFHVVRSPPCFLPAGHRESYMHCFQLRELRRCLCVVHHVRGERVDIWLLKKTKNSTSYNTKEQEYQSWTWSREFSIAWRGWFLDKYKPFALTKSGKVLLWRNRNILSRYDPKTATTKRLVEDDVWRLRFFEAIPHMNSFVSLKSLGEKCSRKRKRYMRRSLDEVED